MYFWRRDALYRTASEVGQNPILSRPPQYHPIICVLSWWREYLPSLRTVLWRQPLQPPSQEPPLALAISQRLDPASQSCSRVHAWCGHHSQRHKAWEYSNTWAYCKGMRFRVEHLFATYAGYSMWNATLLFPRGCAETDLWQQSRCLEHRYSPRNVGILTYELLIGRVPFEIRTEDDLERVVEDEIYFPKGTLTT